MECTENRTRGCTKDSPLEAVKEVQYKESRIKILEIMYMCQPCFDTWIIGHRDLVNDKDHEYGSKNI